MSDSGYASLGPTLLARKGGAKPAMRPQLPVLSDAAEVAKLADEQLDDLGWNDMGDEAASASDTASVVVPIDPETPFDAAAAAASPIVRRQQRRLEERVLADAVMPHSDSPEIDEDGVEAGEWADDFAQDNTACEDADQDDDGADYSVDYGAAGDEDDDAADYAESDHDPFDASNVAAIAPAPHGESPLSVRKSAPEPKAAAVTARRAAFTLRLDPERHLKLRLAATMKGVSAQALVTDALDAMLAEFEELHVIAAHLQRH